MEDKKYANKKQIALINSITGIRFLGSFLVIPIFKALGGVSAAIFSIIFGLSDFIDGKLAKHYNGSTFFGAIFDAFSDKFYGIMALLLLMPYNPVAFSIPIILELAIFLTQNKKFKNRKSIQSNKMGKFKTWFLFASIVFSFGAIDILNIPEFLDYIKNASLSKVAAIRDFLVLSGISLPAIVTQILTLRSYNKEAVAKEEIKEEVKEENINPEIDEIIEEIDKNLVEKQIIQPEDVSINLQEIEKQRQELEQEYTLLEQLKKIGNLLFDPEYYDKNKDMPTSELIKSLKKDKNKTKNN